MDPPAGEFGRTYNKAIRSLAAVPEPSSTIAFLETERGGTVLVQNPKKDSWTGTHWWWSVLNDGTAWLASTCGKNQPPPVGANCQEVEWDWKGLVRHAGGGNYTFADGHVKFMLPDMTLRKRQTQSPTGNLWVWDKDTPPGF